MDLSLKNKYHAMHFVGIKGVAMTALAVIAKELGIRVTGSDLNEEFPTDETLKRFDIFPFQGFSVYNLPKDTDLVVYTGAHDGSKNIEVIEAKLKGIPVVTHAQALKIFLEGKKVISVAGSHGKTTTASIIAYILKKGGFDPSYAVGCGEIIGLGAAGHMGNGEWFVAEADEYVNEPGIDKTPRFLWQKPEILLITNIDYDHPDVYQNLGEVEKAFVNFAQNVTDKGTVVINKDDPPTFEIAAQIKRKIITYAKNNNADFKLLDYSFSNRKTIFTVKLLNNQKDFIVSLAGEHNALNAVGAIAVLTEIGISPETIKSGLSQFSGTKRRFEFIVERNNKLLYDDFAHHPAEIKATLKSVKEWFPKKRLIVIFQPHTYSRTKALLHEFATSFENCDELILTEIYASAREKHYPEISGKLLYENTFKYKKEVYFAPNKTDVLEYIKNNTQKNDLIITMGAGNIYSWLTDIKMML